jgi:four helix bundle protein
MHYDLENRTSNFSKKILSYLKNLKITFYNKEIIDQLLRACLSIGANYREANGSTSKKDFHNKIAICKKETKEAKYWIELLTHTLDDEKDKKTLRDLWQETHELTLIFSKIHKSSK